jgi:two-component system NtrC family response regulator
MLDPDQRTHSSIKHESPRVLIVEDEPLVRKSIASIVESIGSLPLGAGSLGEARRFLKREKLDVVLLDLRLPDGDGLELLDEILLLPEPAEVIILTGSGDPDGAETALKSGAWDYLVKPLTPTEIALALRRVLEYRKHKTKLDEPPLDRSEIIGSGPEMARCLLLVGRVANSDEAVLITGETGTGKELFARAVHANSSRSDSPFVTVDCAALTESIIESILFGSKRGAFTGADRDRTGLIIEADGGTLFLDEVGELPLGAQRSFLRVLQEKRFRPVGASSEVHANFRLVSATNRDLDRMVAEGTFREDLMFRLRAGQIEIPPLRSRTPELRDLIVYFLDRLAKKNQTAVKGFTPDFLEMLTLYTWPGNVRELLGALEHAFSNGRTEPVLYPIDLPVHIRVAVARSALGKREQSPWVERGEFIETNARPTWKTYRLSALVAVERQYFRDLLDSCGSDLQEASRISGVGRTRLYELLKKSGLLQSAKSDPDKADASANSEPTN